MIAVGVTFSLGMRSMRIARFPANKIAKSVAMLTGEEITRVRQEGSKFAPSIVF